MARDQSFSTEEDVPLVIELGAAEEGVDELDWTVLSGPANGSVSFLSPGRIAYTPNPEFSGSDSFVFEVGDGLALSASATITVLVQAVNDPPRITGQSRALTTLEDTPLALGLGDLTVSDPDHDAADLVLVLVDGADYTHDGDTVTPALNFNGELTVQVQVSDGQASSESFSLTVTVTPVNDPPVITGQNEVSIPEDSSRLLALTDLHVVDPEGDPVNFAVQDGEAYTRDGNTITPERDFNGVLTVPVEVSDGEGAATSFELRVTVLPINDPPVITAQLPATTPEDTAREIALADLVVADPDNVFPDDFSLTVHPGTGYTFNANVVTPALDFFGVLTIPVTVSDGTDSSAPFLFELSVSPVDETPVITGQVALSMAEDSSLTLSLADLVVVDRDSSYPEDFSLTVLAGANYTVSGATITPAQDYHGTLSVEVQVNDGGLDSPPFALEVVVTPVNDPPVITGQRAVSMPEDSSLTLTLAHLEVTDVDGPSLTLEVLDGVNYTRSGARITPAPEFNGELTVPVAVSDSDGGRDTFDLLVTVTAVNDAPVIVAAEKGSTPEDTPYTLQLPMLTVEDPDNSFPDDFTLKILDGADYTHAGNVITPARDFNGTLTVMIVVSDGQADSAPFAFTLTVIPVDDVPMITGQRPLTTAEDVPITIVLADLLVSNPDGVPLTLVVGAGGNYTREGATVTPALDFNGELIVPVMLSGGGFDSEWFQLQITVTPVPDAPRITGQKLVSTPEEVPLTLSLDDLIIVDPDSSPAELTLLVGDGADYTRSGPTLTPRLDFNGTLTVPVRVNDGTADSESYDLQVTVTPVNDPPVILGLGSGPLTVADGAPLTLTLADLVVTDVDHPDQSGFVVKVQDGLNYARSGNTIIQDAGYEGMLQVAVVVSDGMDDSEPFTIEIAATWNWAPVAGPDRFETTGNTLLESSPTRNVLANDSDPEDTTVTISAFPTSSAGGGVVSLAPDGTFSYLPKAGFTGNDTFTYTVKDSENKTTQGTVTIVVGARVWYVKADQPAPNTGRSTDPFPTLALAQDAATLGTDVIFVFAGSYTGTITLKDNQKLLGEGVGLVRAPNPPIPAGARPTLNAAGGTAITLGKANTVAGFSIVGAASAVFGNKGGGAILGQLGIATSGRGIFLQASSGLVSLSDITVASPTQDAISVEASSGTLSVTETSVTGGQGRGLVARGLKELSIVDSGVSLASKGAALDVSSTVLVKAVLASLSSTGPGVPHGLRLEDVTEGSFQVKGGASFANLTTAGILARRTGTLALIFDRIDVNGAPVGIDYDTAAGSLSVSAATLTDSGGMPPKDSGGTIQNTTGPGIRLANVRNVALNNLTIKDTQSDGIQIVDGKGVDGLSLYNAALSGIGNNLFQFALNLGVGANQLTGTALLEATTIGGLSYGGLYLENLSGTLDLTMREVTLTGTGNHGSGVVLRSSGTANTSFVLETSSFGAINGSGDGIALGTAGGPSRLTATIEDCTFHNPSVQGNSAVRITNDGPGSRLTATVDNNEMSRWNGTPIVVEAGDEGSEVRATLSNNTIGLPGVALSGSNAGHGILVLLDADPATTRMDGMVAITNNTVQQVANHGIYVIARDGAGIASANRLDATVTGNTVGMVGPLFDGITLRSLDATLLCANIAMNVSQMGAGGVGAYHLRQAGTSAFWLQGLAGTNRSASEAQSHVTASGNTGTPVFASGTYNVGAPGTPCRTP